MHIKTDDIEDNQQSFGKKFRKHLPMRYNFIEEIQFSFVSSQKFYGKNIWITKVIQ